MKVTLSYIKGLLVSSFLRLGAGFAVFYLRDFLTVYSEKLLGLWIVALVVVSVFFPCAGVALQNRKDLFPLKYLYIAQSVTDVFLAETLIILTGGIESWFSLTLFIITIGSSILVGKRWGMATATLGGLLYGVLIDLQYYRVIKVPYTAVLSAQSFIYNIFLNISGLYLTALLMGYMISRLEKTSESLKRKDHDLIELSRFHSEVVENVPSGLFTTDIYGNITFINRAGLRILGRDRSQIIGQRVTTVFPFLTIPLPRGRINGRIEDQDGSVRYIGMNVSEYINSLGQSIGFIGTFQDVTQIVEMERQIKTREKLSAIGELAASIAHEIRNPLGSIKNSIEMLKDRTLPEELKDKLMNIAITEMERLNKIITDFLSYSRPRPPVKKEFSLSGLVRDMVQAFGMTEEKIRVEASIEEGIQIKADEEMLRQAIWNLLKNAKEAVMERSNGEPGIEVFLRRTSANTVSLTVSDNGPGIEDEIRKKIFFPFFSTKKQGTGLGLALVDRIIQEHNGKITVTSEKGKGTSFIISLPLDSDEGEDSHS